MGGGTLTALELALEAIQQSNADELSAAKARALMTGYDARWKDVGWVAIAVEEFGELPLFNIETGRQSRSFRMAGKKDVIAEYEGRRYVFDHKTVSSDITDPNAPFWRQLAIEGQVSHYMLMEWIAGTKVDGAVWDVVRKPTIRPKQLTKAVKATILKDGTYCGFPVPIPYREQVLSGMEAEDACLYELRLTRDCLDRPDYYFQRRPVPRLDSELVEYAHELWEHSKEILHARSTNRHARNSGACMLYGSPCKFLGICSGHDTPDSDKWERRQQVHPELDGCAQGDGRNLLTTSRVRCFQTCRRKEYYQYELGLERLDEEERETLRFGRLWHTAQEAWWRYYLR